MAVYCTTEEAREFVAMVHPDDLELPRRVNFDNVNNHFMAAVIFAAMGEPGHRHNLEHLYVTFRVRRPNILDKHLDKPTIRTQAYDVFEVCERNAKERIAAYKDKEMTTIDALDFEIANTWGMDDGPVAIYAVNTLGVTALVTHMGGWMKPTNPNWQNVALSIQFGIKREFEQAGSTPTA